MDLLGLKSGFVRQLGMIAFALMLVCPLSGWAQGTEAGDPFAHPPELEKDVRFWIRVYTEVTTNEGLIHDDWNLGLVYEVLHFGSDASPSQRERRVSEAKAHYAALLRRLAAGSTDNLSAHEQRILHAFGDKATASDFRDAIERIRFQLGQADRFHEGLIRSAVWEKQIARTLAQHGVPVEIAALPHVESSFNLAAYSKVGAAGLWQFMPSTAKRYMRVDSLVDERLDPYTATEAAANLMLYNYRLVGTWPLAVTAYNHGPGGLRRAQDELGTSSIAVIVKRYQGATFGFASRNFYVAFLAALEVDRNAEKYFGPLTRLPDTDSTPVPLPDYIAVDALAKAFKVDMGALRVLNPALRPPIWGGSKLVPRGYALRLPGSLPQAEIAAGWSRLPPAQRYVAQRNDGAHRMRRGETLAGIAAVSGISLNRLLAANGWNSTHSPARGETVRIPMPASRADAGGAAPAELAVLAGEPGVSASDAATAVAPPAQSTRSAQTPPRNSTPGSGSASSAGSTLAPNSTASRSSTTAPGSRLATNTASPGTASSGATTVNTALAGTAISIDTTTAHPAPDDHEYVVRPGDVLSKIARRTGTSERELKEANGLKDAESIYPGQRLKLGGAAIAAAAAAVAAQAAGLPVAGEASTSTVTPPVAAVAAARAPKEPVSEQQTQSSALLPAATPTGRSDTTDYSIGEGNTVIVQAAETLGHYADWSGVSSEALRAHNKLRKNAMVTVGHRFKLDLSKVSAEQFTTARREYHRHLEETFFAAHRISGTESYAVKRGESLWMIAQQRTDLPVWLVAEYNPDVDFNDVRPGTTITLPRVETINRQ